MIDESIVYSKIGKALISVQRVEFLTEELLKLLTELDESFYGITTSEFLSTSKKSLNTRLTLGNIFKILKLNPKFVIEAELNEYLKMRNILVHNLWRKYMTTKSQKQLKLLIEFCDKFDTSSNQIESYFKGFLYFLSLRHVHNSSYLHPEIKKLKNDFEYFIKASTVNGTKLPILKF